MTELPRPHPFDLVFAGIAEERFPPIRDALGNQPTLDAFMMSAPAINLLQELRPDEGLEGGGGDFLALVYAAYRFWSAGQATIELPLDATRKLCAPGGDAPPPSAQAKYIQVAPRLIWGSLDGGQQFEPLDGWFAVPGTPGLLAVALFGVHSGRPGLTVISVEGECPSFPPVRGDGSPAFAPLMAGGDLAGLYALATLEELLLIACRGSADHGRSG